MDSFKQIARQAKKRMKNNFWQDCKDNLQQKEEQAKTLGINERKVKSYIGGKVQKEIKGESPDGFYLKVKELLETEGEVSDAIGRLTDKEYYETLSYEEKQRYTLNLSAKYLAALEKYRHEKELSKIT
ncbi:MAG: hypothetical protein LUF82_00880 [Clostridia bacterium]|nr:hypothetical protein [Clostridia bacterium]